MTVKLHLQEIM